MKKLIGILTGIALAINVSGQLKATPVCPDFVVNVLEGNVNGIEPSYTVGQIKKAFPCFSTEEPENDSSHCGGLLAYQDKDLYFYTGRDYVEIRENFKGKLSIPLMGAERGILFKWLGHPKLKDVSWDAFETAYGVLVLHYSKENKINLIQFSKKSTTTLRLCE